MNKKRISSLLGAITASAMLVGSTAQAAPAQIPPNFANEAFKNVWTRTDALVDAGTVKRGYYWGPTPGYTSWEDYAEGPGGKHLVQYFDKSRMEINNPDGDKNNPFYVTNGLLTRELINGRVQTGNNTFIQSYPAEIDIASDTDDANAPTYASFRAVSSDSSRSAARSGQTVIEAINRAGLVGTDTRYSSYGVKYAYLEPATAHNIPDKFWDFLNATGPVMVNGKQVNARLNDPYFYATGFPIAEAFWASVKIAGVPNTAVLIQPYERRVLTYVPSAIDGYKVQMGNIGQHYYMWRYQDVGKPRVPTVNCDQLPVRGFGKVWAEHPMVQVNLGCTRQREQAATVSHQYFEHGEMLGVVQRYSPYGGSYRLIYVLFDDFSLQRFEDTYVEGETEPKITPPPGLYAPTGSFGKVWREGTGARVREKLGWATAPETVAVAQLPPTFPIPTATPRVTPTPVQAGQGGAIQDFYRGVMVYAGPVLKKIYVLYSLGGDNSRYLNRWEVYNDTFREPKMDL